MLELGAGAPGFHREAGRRAAATRRIDWIVGVQGAAAELVRGAVEAGHPAERAQFFASSEDAAKFFAGFVGSGDLLLVKGSRGVRMERIVDALIARHALLGAAAEAGTASGGRKERR
jgi:UDP-N-acetylmuramoyl-tripeptide--D-alanyl-D-alanine ligase